MNTQSDYQTIHKIRCGFLVNAQCNAHSRGLLECISICSKFRAKYFFLKSLYSSDIYFSMTVVSYSGLDEKMTFTGKLAPQVKVAG